MRKLLKKYNLGGVLSSIGGMAQAYSQNEDGTRDAGGSFISGAANGAQLGSIAGPAGAVIGGIVGGIKGMRGAEANNRDVEKRKRKIRLYEDEMQSDADRAYLQTFPTTGVQSSGFYATGGKLGDPPGTTPSAMSLMKQQQVGAESTATRQDYRTLYDDTRMLPKPLVQNDNRYYQIPEKELNIINTGIETFNKKLRSSGYEGRLMVKDPVTGRTTFAAGGDMKGGRMIPLTGEVDKVSGDTHEQGGVALSDNTGEEVAEVEGGEVMKDGRYVFSNRIGEDGVSYAAQAAAVATSPQYKQQEMQKGKAKKRLLEGYGGVYDATSKRVTERKDLLDVLFDKQEARKQEESNTQYAAMGADLLAGIKDNLGSFKDNIGDLAPYVDNITNAALINKTPNIPAPRLNAAPRLQTTYRIDDQLAAIETGAQTRDRNIIQGSSNSATTRANLLAGRSESTRQTNEALGNKQRQEIDLGNAQTVATYQNNISNNAMLGQYDTNRMYREDDIQQRISQNVADVSTNMQQQGRDEVLDIRDTQALALTAMKYLESGVLDRSGYSQVMKALQEGKGLDEALALLEQLKTSTQQNVTPGQPLLSSANRQTRRLLDTNTINDNVFNSGQRGNT